MSAWRSGRSPPLKRMRRPAGPRAATFENLNNSSSTVNASWQGLQCPAMAGAVFTVVRWIPFFWRVLGQLTIACGDLVVDVEICEIAGSIFALAKRPPGFSESDWSTMLDTAVRLARQTDPQKFAGTTDMFGEATR